MKSRIFILLFISLCLTACEKTINIDYHDIRPLYTVEGWLTPYETMVRVSMTKNMEDTTAISNITNAHVTITDEDGNTYEIPHEETDYYHTRDYTGEPGKTYRLDVIVDNNHFTSTSTMYGKPTISNFRVVWKNMMSERYIFGDVRIQDIPNEVNYYYIHIYRNDIPYRSAVLKDDTNPNRELQQLFAFNRDGSTDFDTLREGDILEVHVRTIDERSYNYLYSVIQMDNTNTNPIDNFTGGCLGYFSAFSIVAETIEFHQADIEEE